MPSRQVLLKDSQGEIITTALGKAQRDPLLDVARASYKENVHDIFELGKSIQDMYSLPIELLYQQEAGGGFMFTLHRVHTEDDGWEWPREWIDRVAKRKKWIFSTLELVSCWNSP